MLATGSCTGAATSRCLSSKQHRLLQRVPQSACSTELLMAPWPQLLSSFHNELHRKELRL